MYTYWPSWARGLRLAFNREPRHYWLLIWAPVIVIVIAFFYSLVAIGRVLDRLLWSRYQKQAIEAPVYIVANMRSGTTYLHRMLEMDAGFSTMKLFHTLFPAITYYKLFAALGILDRWVGRPLGRLVGLIDSVLFAKWDGIHSTGFGRAEEDEMYWLYAGLSPAISFFFPFPAFDEAMFPDRLTLDDRMRVADYYEDNIRRHVFANPGKTFLAKNALIAGRIEIVYERMSDMRLVHLVRHPYQVIPSKISMFEAVWKMSTPGVRDFNDMAAYIADVTIEYYLKLEAFAATLPSSQYMLIRYEDLISDPAASVASVYQFLGRALTPDMEQHIRAACEKGREYKSTHSYSLEQYGLERDEIYQRLAPLFEKYGWEREL